jgi:hypothetical protein
MRDITGLRLTRLQVRRDLHEEEIIPDTRYIVVQQVMKSMGPTTVRLRRCCSRTNAAQKLGEQGENTQVGLMGEHGRFRAESTYGKDPYPPQGLLGIRLSGFFGSRPILPPQPQMRVRLQQYKPRMPSNLRHAQSQS